MHTIQSGHNDTFMTAVVQDPLESTAGVSAEERQAMIAAAAYRRYEQRGGGSSDPLNDWLEAEKETDAALAGSETFEETKSGFLQRVSGVLAECQAQLEELGGKAQAANAVLKRKYEEQLVALGPKYEAARGKLVEIRGLSDQAWGHLREGAVKAANEMRIAVREATSLFK